MAAVNSRLAWQEYQAHLIDLVRRTATLPTELIAQIVRDFILTFVDRTIELLGKKQIRLTFGKGSLTLPDASSPFEQVAVRLFKRVLDAAAAHSQSTLWRLSDVVRDSATIDFMIKNSILKVKSTGIPKFPIWIGRPMRNVNPLPPRLSRIPSLQQNLQHMDLTITIAIAMPRRGSLNYHSELLMLKKYLPDVKLQSLRVIVVEKLIKDAWRLTYGWQYHGIGPLRQGQPFRK